MANNNGTLKMKITGTAMWAHVRKPETYKGNELGYSIHVVMEDDALKKFEGAILEFLADELENGSLKDTRVDRRTAPTLPIKEDKNGKLSVKAKTKHYIENKATGERMQRILPIFDKTGQPLDTSILIGNGSIVQVAVEAKPYVIHSKNYGITLYLSAILVKELKEYNADKNATSYGFDIEESEDTDGEELEF